MLCQHVGSHIVQPIWRLDDVCVHVYVTFGSAADLTTSTDRRQPEAP